MPNDNSPVTLPRKKPSVLWLLAGVFALLIFLFCYQLFGPNPPIVVSKETTYITTPLGPDGLPDYEQYVLDRYREGVTPENNAAALIWQALWPGDLDPSQYAAVARELGLDHLPSEEDSLQLVYKSNRGPVDIWLKGQGISTNDDSADDIIQRASQSPWTKDQLPPLVKWIENNQQPLDLLVEASRRPRCYFPSPSLLENERDLLIAMLLPGVQGAREAARALPVRAMWHLGEVRHAEAWQDLLAIHRIGHLVAQGQTLVEILTGIAIEGIGTQGTLALLSDDRLTIDQARQIQRDLAALPHFNGMAKAMDSMERLSALDAVTGISSQELGAFEMLAWGGVTIGPLSRFLDTLSIDWNVALWEINRWYDRIASAAQNQDHQARSKAIAAIESDLQRFERQIGQPSSLAGAIFSRARRSQIVASAMLSLFVPAVKAAMSAEDRANTSLDLLRLAAALAVYRAEHGAYPDKLEALAPDIVDKLPVDLYHAKSFIYKRTADGYLLYSTGANGIDDGGSNEQMNIAKGRRVDEAENPDMPEKLRANIPAGADDHSIRMPRPAFVLPKPAEDTAN